MVSTATFRPASAAATAMAAAVVVLPTPPEPQVTTTCVAGFLTRANRFIAGRVDGLIRTPRCAAASGWSADGSLACARSRRSPRSAAASDDAVDGSLACARSRRALLGQHVGQLVDAAEVDPVDEPGEGHQRQPRTRELTSQCLLVEHSGGVVRCLCGEA